MQNLRPAPHARGGLSSNAGPAAAACFFPRGENGAGVCRAPTLLIHLQNSRAIDAHRACVCTHDQTRICRWTQRETISPEERWISTSASICLSVSKYFCHYIKGVYWYQGKLSDSWSVKYPTKIVVIFYEAECPGGCRNGGFCNERHVCECPDGFYGPHCEKGNLKKSSQLSSLQ